MTEPLKAPLVNIHPSFREGGSDFEEIAGCAVSFLGGDCGDIDDEDSVLKFLDSNINDRPRHGVYETRTGGRVHVLGTSERVAVIPDIIFAQGLAGAPPCDDPNCSCQRNQDKTDEPSLDT